jgi:hypothetical protein
MRLIRPRYAQALAVNNGVAVVWSGSFFNGKEWGNSTLPAQDMSAACFPNATKFEMEILLLVGLGSSIGCVNSRINAR